MCVVPNTKDQVPTACAVVEPAFPFVFLLHASLYALFRLSESCKCLLESSNLVIEHVISKNLTLYFFRPILAIVPLFQ